MPHNENSRVKIPALVHFTRLGYKYISLRKYEGVIDDDTNILVDVLCDAINRINATSLTTTDVQKIVNTLKAMHLYRTNHQGQARNERDESAAASIRSYRV